ncbi:MAG TPA: DUF2188 domain-containing protein [Cytophagaceae bacterium]
MEKAVYHIFPGQEGWELYKEGDLGPIIRNGETETDVLIIAMEKTKQEEASEVVVHNEDGWIETKFYHPHELYEEEHSKREELIQLIGTYLRDNIKVPVEVYAPFFTYTDINELYQHLLDLLQESPNWYTSLFDKKLAEDFFLPDEIVKRDNIVYLVGRYLEYNSLASVFVFGTFYSYQAPNSLEEFYEDLTHIMNKGESDAYVEFVIDLQDLMVLLNKEMRPVYSVSDGIKRIIGWKPLDYYCEDGAPLTPIYDYNSSLIAWLDPMDGLCPN